MQEGGAECYWSGLNCEVNLSQILPALCPALLGNWSCLSGYNMPTKLLKWLKGIHVFSKQAGGAEVVLIL